MHAFPANENRRERMSLEAMQENPCKAVELPLPEDADRTLLAAAAFCADKCANIALDHMLVAGTVEGSRDGVKRYAQRGREALRRRDEAQAQLGQLPPEQISKVSPFLHPRETEEKAWRWLAGSGRDEHDGLYAEQRLRERDGRVPPVTRERIAENPWHAVFGEIPKDAGNELLRTIAARAEDLQKDALWAAIKTRTKTGQQQWTDHADRAKSRWEEAEFRLEARESDGANAADNARKPSPELSRATLNAAPQPAADIASVREATAQRIADDPWSAVTAPIPEGASLDLLHLIAETAQQLQEYASARGDAASNPNSFGQLSDEAEHWFDLADAAGSRFEDAALKHYDAVARVGWEAPAFSRETIAADPWTAVYLPVPERADAGLLAAARSWASDLRQYATADGVLSGPLINRAH
jgi:hypothetical protein